METIYPQKLQPGDEIRVISPSDSLERVGGFDDNLISQRRLEDLGFKVSFGRHIAENDRLSSASIASRLADFHEAFADPAVKAVLPTIGGFSSNELLPHIDWEVVRAHPKLFFGYSDITSLHNAIHAKTGLVTYYSPVYSSFKMDALQDFQTSQWLKAVTGETSYQLTASDVYTSDPWFDPTQPRRPLKNQWKVYNPGRAAGTIVGGNIQTYGLQAGTEFLPKLERPLAFLEEAEEGDVFDFDRLLAQFLQINPDTQALVLGRFPREVEMDEELLLFILDKYPRLKQIPVIYDVDFGHTQPIFTFPLGGSAVVDADRLEIVVTRG